MKKINVIVKDRNTLILDEDACKGDYIDLSSLSSIDFSTIDDVINDGKDNIYNQKLNEHNRIKDAEKEKEILQIKQAYESRLVELKAEIEKIKSNNDLVLKQQLLALEMNKDKEINVIKNQYDLLHSNYNKDLEALKLTLGQAHLNEITKLKSDIEEIQNHNDIQIAKLNFENEKEILNLKNEFLKELNEKDRIIQEKDSQYMMLQRQKAVLNIKQTGEDLESWCNNEVLSYMQNGLFNCSWIKDNKVIKDDGDVKGSKADYIFNVYASNNKNDNELLTSVCLEMKDENPDSTNKKKNSDYYSALDKNRAKKNCKYAILVSNLESDKSNDLPIFKVFEYPDMYVVRPAYMMTLLNLLTSLSMKFSEVILADNEQKLMFKSQIEFQAEFEALQKTYLDSPLERLKKDLEGIKKNNEAIMNASRKIDDLCDSITRSYISQIEEKLSKFSLKVNKEYKKLN